MRPFAWRQVGSAYSPQARSGRGCLECLAGEHLGIARAKKLQKKLQIDCAAPAENAKFSIAPESRRFRCRHFTDAIAILVGQHRKERLPAQTARPAPEEFFDAVEVFVGVEFEVMDQVFFV